MPQDDWGQRVRLDAGPSLELDAGSFGWGDEGERARDGMRESATPLSH